MDLIEKQHCLEWCSSRRIKSSGMAHIDFFDPKKHKIAISLPKEFLKCIPLVLALETTFEMEMVGSLLWIRDWGIWSEKTEAIGIAYWKKFRPEKNRDLLTEYPGHLFSENDAESLRALLLLPILFQWDAQWITPSGEAIANVKHDASLEILIRGDTTEKIIGEIKSWAEIFGLHISK
jgi:hypothetical protein